MHLHGEVKVIGRGRSAAATASSEPGPDQNDQQVDIASLIQWYQRELPGVIEQRSGAGTLELLIEQAAGRVSADS